MGPWIRLGPSAFHRGLTVPATGLGQGGDPPVRARVSAPDAVAWPSRQTAEVSPTVVLLALRVRPCWAREQLGPGVGRVGALPGHPGERVHLDPHSLKPQRLVPPQLLQWP